MNRRGQNFNPRSRVGSDWYFENRFQRAEDFNPRSRVGSDIETPENCLGGIEFQSTLPCRERLCSYTPGLVASKISIHAPV